MGNICSVSRGVQSVRARNADTLVRPWYIYTVLNFIGSDEAQGQ